VRHGQTPVIFAVGQSCDRRNRAPRDNLAEENYTSFHDTVDATPHVESQIHLVEIAMKRNGNSQDFRVQETEAYQADEGFAIESVQFGA